MAYLKSFDRSNVLARRFASAAHFYKAPFATEAALVLTRENAANGLYESLANGAMLVHDDPQNILRAQDIHKKLRPSLFVSPPVCRAAVLYPLADEMLEIDNFQFDAFVDRAAPLRHECDYDICDECMIRDGYLDRLEDLLVLVPTVIGEESLSLIQSFLRRGGRVWLCGAGSLRLMDERATLREIPWQVKDAIDRSGHGLPGGVYRTATWPRIAPFDELANGGSVFHTVHQDCVSCYSPQACSIERAAVPPVG